MDAMTGTAGPVAEPASDIKIGLEAWQQLWPDCRPLMLAHRDELKQNDPRTPLRPDTVMIGRLETFGNFLAFGARQDSALVGYSIWYLMPSLETAGVRMAEQGPWYVKPEFRASGIGVRLWNESMRELRARNISLLRCHYPPETPGLGAFFARKGGKVIGTQVSIWLPDPAKVEGT